LTNILALETSTDICSVSIRKGVDVFNFHESLPRQHTENLLSVISELLNESKLGFKDLDAIAVGVGPGSYTGVRLSCAIAQGIAFSHDIKGLILSSLELIAIEAFNKTNSSHIVGISEVNMENVYISESRLEDGDIYSKFKLIKQDEFNIQDFHDDSLFVGPGCSQFPELTNKLEGASPKAIHLLDIAEKRSRQNLLKEPEEFLPIYLNDENSWKKLK